MRTQASGVGCVFGSHHADFRPFRGPSLPADLRCYGKRRPPYASCACDTSPYFPHPRPRVLRCPRQAAGRTPAARPRLRAAPSPYGGRRPGTDKSPPAGSTRRPCRARPQPVRRHHRGRAARARMTRSGADLRVGARARRALRAECPPGPTRPGWRRVSRGADLVRARRRPARLRDAGSHPGLGRQAPHGSGGRRPAVRATPGSMRRGLGVGSPGVPRGSRAGPARVRDTGLTRPGWRRVYGPRASGPRGSGGAGSPRLGRRQPCRSGRRQPPRGSGGAGPSRPGRVVPKCGSRPAGEAPVGLSGGVGSGFGRGGGGGG